MEITSALLIASAAAFGGFIWITGSYLGLWFQAFISGAHISLFNIIGIRMRKIPPKLIVSAMINLRKAGIKNVASSDIETHYLAGGKISNVIKAVVAADKANINLSWRQATAIDLAGRDVFEAVKTSVHPKVIDCPTDGYISAVAQNGIELLVKARVTVRTNLVQLVGGATEETIIARVGEGIVSVIGSSESHYCVLKDPQKVSESVLEKGLDSQTAFEILSIDIADINVGCNVGAKLQTEQAMADTKVAQAKAEERRSMAVALEQEYKAKVVEAESKIPLAIATAFEKGQLGIMDYNKLKNLQADTTMRLAFSQDEVEEDN